MINPRAAKWAGHAASMEEINISVGKHERKEASLRCVDETEMARTRLSGALL
jgi:hypothetical protein